SKFRTDLENKWGKLLFDKVSQSLKTFDPVIMEDLQKENKLTTEHGKLISSAQIEFNGEVYNLSQMAPFLEDKDREKRKAASLLVSKFFEDNEEELDRIYDELVKVRTVMAQKLGYESYIELAYDNL